MDRTSIQAKIDEAFAKLEGAPPSVQLAMALATAMRPLVSDITDEMSVDERAMFYKSLLAGIGGFIEASLGIGSAAPMLIEQADIAQKSEAELRSLLMKMGH